MLANQVFYHMSHTSSPFFALVILEMGSHEISGSVVALRAGFARM
jgi:hypothetical protein